MSQDIAIIGATGMVGLEIIKYLEVNDNINLTLYASKNSEGKMIKWKDDILVVKELNYDDLKNFDFIFNASSSEISKNIPNYITKKNILIDNSSYFRMYQNVPLIIPEINIDELHNNNIIANPNCSTIILCMALYPFHLNFGIKKIIVSTYQAASGAGINGYNELIQQADNWVNNTELTQKYWNKQYIWNVFSHNSTVDIDTGYNGEETKMINETKKIFGDVDISVTCVRVPTLRSHCESIDLILEKPTNENLIREILKESEGVVVLDDRENNVFPETVTSHEKTDVFVGRIRKDLCWDKEYPNQAWKIFVSGDQVAKGASWNACQILNNLINKKLSNAILNVT